MSISAWRSVINLRSFVLDATMKYLFLERLFSHRPKGRDALDNSFFRLMREIVLSTCIFKHLPRDEKLSLFR